MFFQALRFKTLFSENQIAIVQFFQKKTFSVVVHNKNFQMAVAHLFVTLVIYIVSRFFASTRPAGRSAGRAAGRPAGRLAKRPAGRLSAAPVSSAAPKKKAFDRGGPVWPPRSNAKDDRLGGGSGGALPPHPKTGGSGGQRPSA